MKGRRRLYEISNRIRERLKLPITIAERAFLQKLLQDLNQGIYWTEEDIRNTAAQFGVRNPAFPGDMVGWLDDDFEPDDDDEEEI
jgi:hypothetical protein